MIEGTGTQARTYRNRRHIRLVSNAVDADHLNGPPNQTPLVGLGDIIRATVLLNNEVVAAVSLPVARPPAEDGINAIRTADIRFVTLQGVESAPGATVQRMTQNWAQVGVKFNLAENVTVTPVTNVLTVTGTATSAGELGVRITPAGGAATDVSITIANEQTSEQIATALAAEISSKQGLTASSHIHADTSQGGFNGYIILVNKGQAVTFANLSCTAASVTFTEPALTFNNDITALEGSVLGLNFVGEDPKAILVIAVGEIDVLDGIGAAGGNYVAGSLPGWRNVVILRQEAVRTNPEFPFAAGHEVGHVLFNGGNALHSLVETNLFFGTASTEDTIGSTKRLHSGQHALAREESGPSTSPGLLQKK